MGRVLIIATACVIGALGTWLFVPTVQPVGVKSDMPVFVYNPDRSPKEDTTVPPKGVMSEEKRRVRAEQLIGKPLKYITDDVVHSAAWFTEQGVQVIERAMDECHLVNEYDLFEQHREAISDEDDADENASDDAGEDGWDERLATLAKTQPTMKQAQNCLSVYRAYFPLHGMKFDF